MTFFLEQKKTQKAQLKQQYKQKKEVLEKELKEVQFAGSTLSGTGRTGTYKEKRHSPVTLHSKIVIR